MTTTTGDPSSLKTPPTLSGGDLVSRLLAATPPYLYNVPLTPHSFFFSEMLRSFVQAKSSSSSDSSVAPSSSIPAITVNSSSNINGRRRKRSWRDARERPLELTTKDKTNNIINDTKYFHKDLSIENRYKSTASTNLNTSVPTTDYNNDNDNKNKNTQNYDTIDKNLLGEPEAEAGASAGGYDPLKPVDENPTDFLRHHRHFFDDPSRLFNNNNNNNSVNNNNNNNNNNEGQGQGQNSLSEENRKTDSVPMNGMGFIGEKKNKLDFNPRNLLRDDLKNSNCGLPAQPTTDFTPSPFWYPPYPIPPQSYPGIDPLHFFIDLRVSGHIWDRKINNERQLSFKSKHCSAFSVPQTVKEYNNSRPLNLTRDEVVIGSCKNKEENFRGTHFILKNLSKTYRDIENKGLVVEKIEEKNDETVGSSLHQDRASLSSIKEDKEVIATTTCSTSNKKDIRALIGLELVVDYVKEPKEEPDAQSPHNE